MLLVFEKHCFIHGPFIHISGSRKTISIIVGPMLLVFEEHCFIHGPFILIYYIGSQHCNAHNCGLACGHFRLRSIQKVL